MKKIMASLYELSSDYAALLAQLDFTETDEEAEAVWAQIDALNDDITWKAEAYARILRNKQAEANAYKAEKTRLAERQKAAENVVERLKKRMLASMQQMNVKSIQTGIGKWSKQLNQASCQVLDESMVPEAYRVPQPDKIDCAGILKWFRETGEILPGVEIAQSEGVRFR